MPMGMINFSKASIIDAFLKEKKHQLTRAQLVAIFEITEYNYRSRQLSHFIIELRIAGILERLKYDVFRIIDVALAKKSRDAFKKQDLLAMSQKKPPRQKLPVNGIDRRMLELPDMLKAKTVLRTAQEFWDAIEITKGNISNIKSGYQKFQVSHLQNALAKYGVNPNWLFGLEDKIFIDLLVRKKPVNTVNKTVNKKQKRSHNLEKLKK